METALWLFSASPDNMQITKKQKLHFNELIGKKFYVTQNKSLENINVEIVKPIFLDPENKRLLS